MVDNVPVSNWTPPNTVPVSRPASGPIGRQDAFDSALRRADSSSSTESSEAEESSIDDSERSDEKGAESMSGRSSVGEGAGRLQFDDRLHRKGASDQELTSEAIASQANSGPSETHADSSSQAMLTTTQTTLMVETLAAMMMRLERMPDANAGQWQFNLLDDPAGISSMQLQRAINGGWKVSVSMLSGSPVEQEQHAGELKSALEQRGHSIESVLLASEQSSDVVKAELDEA